MRYQAQVWLNEVMTTAQVLVVVRDVESANVSTAPPLFRRHIDVQDVDQADPADWLKEALIGVIEAL